MSLTYIEVYYVGLLYEYKLIPALLMMLYFNACNVLCSSLLSSLSAAGGLPNLKFLSRKLASDASKPLHTQHPAMGS